MRLAVFLLAVVAPCAVGAVPLEAFTRCDGFADGVRAGTLDHRPPSSAPWREVVVGGTPRLVSVVDGYRVTYSYPRHLAFATLRVERSDPARYAEDKATVAAYFAEMARADPGLDLVESGDSQTLSKRALAGRTLAMTQIFFDAEGVIARVSFHNQEPGHRRFQTFEEFARLRDAFTRGYIECVRKRASS